MTKQRSFTDAELTAYLDGEADPATGAAIKATLASDAALQSRLAALQIPAGALNKAFGQLLAAAPAAPELPPARSTDLRNKRPYWTMAACLALGVAIGAGFTLLRPKEAGWMDYVAAYQALYVNATLASVEAEPQEEADARLGALGAVLGRDLGPARTDSVLRFKRGQILGYQGNPLIQLAYLSPTGDPVALCIIRTDNPDQSGVTLTQLEGMAAAYWYKDGLGYLLIGGKDGALIRDAAGRMAAKL